MYMYAFVHSCVYLCVHIYQWLLSVFFFCEIL